MDPLALFCRDAIVVSWQIFFLASSELCDIYGTAHLFLAQILDHCHGRIRIQGNQKQMEVKEYDMVMGH